MTCATSSPWLTKATPKISARSCARARTSTKSSASAQATFNAWSKLPPEERTAAAILDALDFDFFELLDSVTIARSRKHIQTFYDTKDIGQFPERRKPLSFHCPLTQRTDVIGFNDIFDQLSLLKLAVYAPVSYILPSRLNKYEDLYDTEVEGGDGQVKQADRERSLQALMTINLLKRLESSVEAFRLTLQSLQDNHTRTLNKIDAFKKTGSDASVCRLDRQLGESRTRRRRYASSGRRPRSAARCRSTLPTWIFPPGNTT